MRTILAGVLLAALLLLAACEQASDTNGSTEAGGDPGATESGDAGLPDGVAATVDGAEIPSEEIDNRFAAAEADEEFAAALEGEQGEAIAAQFRAQTLSVMVQTHIVLDGAEEMDATPSDEDVESTRAEIVEEFGGDEEFDEAVAASGMSAESFEEQLRGVAALDLVGRTLVERGEVPEPPEGAEGLDPEQLAVQQWLAERLAAADVVVDPAYGEWNAQAGQVTPPGQAVAPTDGAPPAGE
jgi:hypothetical protein